MFKSSYLHAGENMDRNGFIYTLQDPSTSQVRYVGQTVDPEKRYNLHLFHSRQGRARTHKEKWINSLLEQGIKPAIEIVWEGKLDQLDKKEIEFIALFKSFGANLTNTTQGGKSTRGRKCSEETKQKFRELFKGKRLRPPITDAEKRATSIRSRGKRASPETRHKISIARKNNPVCTLTPLARKNANKAAQLVCSVPVIAIKDGIETRFISQNEASIATGVDRKTMRGVLKGHYKQSKGFIFKYCTR